MKIQVYHKPVYHIVIDDLLPQAENTAIFDHLISLEKNYVPASMGHEGQINKEYRSNLNLNMDALYHVPDEFDQEKIKEHRATSPLLKMLDTLITDERLLSMLDSAPFPLQELRYCDYWSTQVSRYGQKDHYRWHYDYIPNDTSRFITLIYYVHHTPKPFTGGELCFTNGLLWENELVSETERVSIEPLNNRLVLFDSRHVHAVLPAQAPDDFKSGRFSVNVWIGRYQEY